METIRLNIIDRTGTEHQVEAPTGMNMNLMEVCKSVELPVEGTCGGMALCASCQVYIETKNFPLSRNDAEQALLDEAWYVEDNSRLGCQIQITAELDGLTVRLAPVDEAIDIDEW